MPACLGDGVVDAVAAAVMVVVAGAVVVDGVAFLFGPLKQALRLHSTSAEAAVKPTHPEAFNRTFWRGMP
jgi:hypothetical protein